MNTKKDTHELERLLNKVIPITNYRGFICEKIIGGYRILGKKVSTPEEVDIEINNSLKNLEKSIK